MEDKRTCKICGKPISDGEVGSTCKAHEGKLRQTATIAAEVPEGWLRMSDVCRKAVAAGLTIGAVVRAAGGDACTQPVLDPVFQVVYVGRGKYMDPAVLTKGFDLLRKAREAAVTEKVDPRDKDRLNGGKPVVKAESQEVGATANALKHAVKK